MQFNSDKHFRGNPCKRDHDGVRYIKHGGCVTCDAEKQKRVRESGYLKQYAAENAGKLSLYQAEYREKNLESLRAKEREYSREHRDQVTLRCKLWVENNPIRARENSHRWMAANPERLAAHRHARRARIAGAPGRHTAADVRDVFVKQNWRCACCGEKTKLTVDHYYPLSAGGSNFRKNLQGLCLPCNLSKHARHPVEFMQSRGYLL